jgi:4-carboxymuconolactone decarboxylase
MGVSTDRGEGRRLIDYQDALRSLALNDEQFIESVLAMDADDLEIPGLDHRTRALVCLGGLLAVGGARSSYQSLVDEAFAAGASVDQIVGILIALTPTIGVARVVSTAPELAVAVGYDIDAALENLDLEPEP